MNTHHILSNQRNIGNVCGWMEMRGVGEILLQALTLPLTDRYPWERNTVSALRLITCKVLITWRITQYGHVTCRTAKLYHIITIKWTGKWYAHTDLSVSPNSTNIQIVPKNFLSSSHRALESVTTGFELNSSNSPAVWPWPSCLTSLFLHLWNGNNT